MESVSGKTSTLSVGTDPKIEVQTPTDGGSNIAVGKESGIDSDANEMIRTLVDDEVEPSADKGKVSKSQQKRLEKQRKREEKKKEREEQLQKETETSAMKSDESSPLQWRFDHLSESFQYLRGLASADLIYADSKAKKALRNINATISFAKSNKLEQCLDGLNHNITKILIDYSSFISDKIGQCASQKITDKDVRIRAVSKISAMKNSTDFFKIIEMGTSLLILTS